jgi:hypothetical protein
MKSGPAGSVSKATAGFDCKEVWARRPAGEVGWVKGELRPRGPPLELGCVSRRDARPPGAAGAEPLSATLGGSVAGVVDVVSGAPASVASDSGSSISGILGVDVGEEGEAEAGACPVCVLMVADAPLSGEAAMVLARKSARRKNLRQPLLMR